MNRKRKQPEGIEFPSVALANAIKGLPEAMKELFCPTFWLTFCCFISVACIYYWGTALIFCIIPRTVWSIFFGG